MKLKQTFLSLCGIAMLTALTTNLHAQVTIGIDEVPAQGAILQLKSQKDIIGSEPNSNKGLSLPRVSLQNVDRLLMSGVEIEDSDNDGEQYKKHIGLTVYNINYFCEKLSKILYPGIYVWDGERWQALQRNENNSNKVWTTQDQDGDSFRAAKFGDAGIWMIDNLAVKKYDTESGVVGDKYLVTMWNTAGNVGNLGDQANPLWAYPAPNPDPITGNPNTGSNDNYYESFREYGLLYNWLAATGGTSVVFKGIVSHPNNSTNQRKVIGDALGTYEVEKMEMPAGGRGVPYIQGICPNGWHLPSDREWNKLEREIFENPEQYSYISNAEQATWTPKVWNNTWDEFHLNYPILSQMHSWSVWSFIPPFRFLNSAHQKTLKQRSIVEESNA